jgi:uncharacterized MAPEG superfamily protein
MAVVSFRSQRAAGIGYIAVGSVIAVGVWFTVVRLLPPLTGLEDLGARMLFTLKCFAIAVLFTLVLGVEAVAHERLVSPAFNPLEGFETPRLKVNQRYLQNTLEQTVVFAAALFGLAAYSPSGAAMRAVVAMAVVWTLSRLLFWLGYHHSAAARGLGAPGMALSMIVLVYVACRFGGEVAGPVGGWTPPIVFLAAEALLFGLTQPRRAKA